MIDDLYPRTIFQKSENSVMADGTSLEPGNVWLTKITPSFVFRSQLPLDVEHFEDWDFDFATLPATALTPVERESVFRHFSDLMSQDTDKWSTDGIFPESGETILGLKATKAELWTTRSSLEMDDLLGFLSFYRSCQWSEEIWKDDPDADFERRVLEVSYSLKQIYVGPEHRGQHVGYALMSALAEVFRRDLDSCVVARPRKLGASYDAEYHSIAGERVGLFCEGEFECAFDIAREQWGWLVEFSKLEIDAGV